MLDGLPKTRADAKTLGVKVYFTGEPCAYGHAAPRRADDGKCVACINARAAKRRIEQPERVKQLAKETRERHRDRTLQSKRDYFHKNKAAILAAAREKYATDPAVRERVKAGRTAWTEANSDRKREADRRWVQENKDRHRENRRRWLASNKDHANALAREYYAADPARWRERSKRWLAKNPEKMAQYNDARRARKAGAEGEYKASDVRAMFKKQGSKCACCGQKKKLTVDHIIPLSKGGTNWPRNLQGLCLSCNSRKSAKDPIKFMQEQGALL